MKKTNKKYLLLSINMFAIAIASVFVIMFVDNNTRYLIACVISTFIGVVSLYLSKSTTPIISEAVDERDQINIEKSSNQTLQIMNYLLSAIIFICLTLYGATKTEVYLIVALTELASIILLLVLSLITQNTYEKKN